MPTHRIQYAEEPEVQVRTDLRHFLDEMSTISATSLQIERLVVYLM